jgi:hypothetical protein
MAIAQTYEPIATTTFGSAASAVTFSSIPSTYTDLVIAINAKSSAGTPSIYLQYNGDTTGTNYSYTGFYATSGALSSYRATNIIWISAFMNGVSPNTFNSGVINIFNYTNTATYKSCLARWNGQDYELDAVAGKWNSTAAINSITLTAQSNLVAGSSFTLYGIKAA